jgi:hypothetical protein
MHDSQGTVTISSIDPSRRFRLVLIKPSHYDDDDGYVIQWFAPQCRPTAWLLFTDWQWIVRRGMCSARISPSRSMPNDETNTRIRADRIARDITRAGAGMVGFVGVQSNQFPRAMDLARRFRALGIDVAIGGFHVSGSLAMLPSMTPELQEAMDLGIVLYAGEAEDGLEVLLRDAAAGTLQPLYNHMATLPNLSGVPIPWLPPDRVPRTAGRMTTFDAGRG